MKRITKEKKKGKLTRAEEDEGSNKKESSNFDLQLLLQVYDKMGGVTYMVPFFVSIGIFTYIEQAKEKQVSEWANASASDQQNEFTYQVLVVFSLAALRALAFIFSAVLKDHIRMESSRKLFFTILDRVMHAPINLYFDVTPVGQIQKKVGADLEAVESGFYELVSGLLMAIFKVFWIVFLMY